jgi:sporulation protein YlmC with PRC-barrel domain
MTQISKLAVSVVCSVALVSGAIAQNQQQQQQRPQQQQQRPQQQAQDDASVTAVVVIGVVPAQNDALAKGLRASKLMHAEVYNERNEKIGKISDLVLAPDGTLSAAVIDVGGFLGVAAHRVAIPVQQFSQIAPRVVLPGATKEALKNLPEFKTA